MIFEEKLQRQRQRQQVSESEYSSQTVPMSVLRNPISKFREQVTLKMLVSWLGSWGNFLGSFASQITTAFCLLTAHSPAPTIVKFQFSLEKWSVKLSDTGPWPQPAFFFCSNTTLTKIFPTGSWKYLNWLSLGPAHNNPSPECQNTGVAGARPEILPLSNISVDGFVFIYKCPALVTQGSPGRRGRSWYGLDIDQKTDI